MESKTWLGSVDPELQAEPVLTAKPSRSSRIRSVSPSAEKSEIAGSGNAIVGISVDHHVRNSLSDLIFHLVPEGSDFL